jgi:hypothetical protein
MSSCVRRAKTYCDVINVTLVVEQPIEFQRGEEHIVKQRLTFRTLLCNLFPIQHVNSLLTISR